MKLTPNDSGICHNVENLYLAEHNMNEMKNKKIQNTIYGIKRNVIKAKGSLQHITKLTLK